MVYNNSHQFETVHQIWLFLGAAKEISPRYLGAKKNKISWQGPFDKDLLTRLFRQGSCNKDLFVEISVISVLYQIQELFIAHTCQNPLLAQVSRYISSGTLWALPLALWSDWYSKQQSCWGFASIHRFGIDWLPQSFTVQISFQIGGW